MATSESGGDHDHPWNDPARLESLYHQEGHSQADIADAMGTDQSVISRALKRHGLRKQDPRPWTDSEVVLELYDRGLSARGIASEIDCDHGTALKWLIQHLTDAGRGTPCTSCEKHFPSSKGMAIHHERVHGESLVLVELECEHCGDEFERVESRAGSYCSSDCRAEGQRGPRVERTCQHCGDDFEIEEYRLKSEPGKYCSTECSDRAKIGQYLAEEHPRWRGGRPQCTCEWCGDSFTGYRGNPNRFCCVECCDEWRSETIRGESHPNWDDSIQRRTCETCGDEFRPRTRQNPNRFCSHKCKGVWMQTAYAGENNPLWAGGTFPYGPGWNERKKESVRKDAGYRCEGCNFHDLSHREHYGIALPVHHKMKARTFDDAEERNSKNNLAALCIPCHAKAEKMAPLYPFAD